MAWPKGKPRTGPHTGGRKKGVPNKINAEAREVFKAMFDRLAPKAEHWIEEAALGSEMVKTQKDGTEVTVRVGADPAKAADLLLRLAEFHIPKLGRTELTGSGEGPVVIQIVKYTGDANG